MTSCCRRPWKCRRSQKHCILVAAEPISKGSQQNDAASNCVRTAIINLYDTFVLLNILDNYEVGYSSLNILISHQCRSRAVFAIQWRNQSITEAFIFKVKNSQNRFRHLQYNFVRYVSKRICSIRLNFRPYFQALDDEVS